MLRSRTGGGKIYDSSEAVDSYVDRHSELHSDASVWLSRVESSLIVAATVTSSQICNSFVTSTFAANAVLIDCPVIACELIAGGTIIRSEVTGASRVSGGIVCDSRVANLTMTGGELNGVRFDARGGYVSRGIWTRPPRVEVIGSGDNTLTITESVVDDAGLNLYCGCFEFPAMRWLKIGDRYGKALGLSVSEVDAIRQIILSWL